MAVRESNYQAKLKTRLEDLFPGSMVLIMDGNRVQGFPDILILHEDRWAALEVKRTKSSSVRPNQEYYVNKLDGMSYAAFIYPEKETEILNDLQRALGA